MGVCIYQTEVHKPTTVLVFEDPWTWQEFDTAMEQVEGLAFDVRQGMDYIFDFRRARAFPSGSLLQFRRAVTHIAENGGIAVIVGLRPFWQVFESLLQKMYPGTKDKLFAACTMDEARLFLAPPAEARV